MSHRLWIAFVWALVGGISFADDSRPTEIGKHLLAAFSDTAGTGGERKLFVYSKQFLTGVEIRDVDSDAWEAMTRGANSGQYYVYLTQKPVAVEEDAAFEVRATTGGALHFVDKLVVTADEEKDKPALEVTGLSEEQRQVALDQSTVYYGADWVHPQTLAQARANEMARTGSMSHWGGGIVRTAFGVLAEGIGCGSGGMPGTCVATNGTAAIGDACAYGHNGMIYRCRLYNSPGTTNGGGGYSYGRGRRGRR